MKKNIYKLALTILTSMSILFSSAQTFEIRTVESDYGYLTVQMRETSGTGTPTTSTSIVDISFVVRYPSGSVSTALICSSNDYNIADALSGEQTSGGYDYYLWQATSTPFTAPSNWAQNVWEDIAVLKATGATGSGLFEIAPNAWDGRSLNWNQGGTDYTPSVNGSVTYSYPTTIYTHVWVGGISGPGADPNRWNQTNNWEDECGGTPSFWPYQTSENVYIPDVSSGSNDFPEGFATGGSAYAYICNNIIIASGAHIIVPNLTSDNGGGETYFDINGDLTVEGTLYLSAKGHATVAGATTINSAAGIVVQATSDGAGSFIDNGTITYGGSGTAKVQTYLSNSAGAGNFDIHLVGPTVDEENYAGSGTGAYLEEFILAGVDTYAYEWDESVANDANAWVNLTSLTDEIYTAKGIGLSTIDNTSHTLEMTGALMTGNISSPSLTFSNNHWELISNPYPSSIGFDNLASDNSGVVNNKYAIWNPAANSWVERSGGSGGTANIQVGQGFFVETNSTGTFDFTNARRTHSDDAFREITVNLLTITAAGGVDGYHDVAIIRFDEEATSGYDINIESEFWESQNSDATSLRSLAEGDLELAINVFPTESLLGEMFSVPLMFDCGYTTEYTLTFDDIETFELGTEVYLEDKQTGDEWVSINDNPIYTFSAEANQSPDRFIVHFFGPTDMEELNIETVDIYSSGQHAYVRNNTQENIKMIYVYNLASELIMSTKVSESQKFTKFWVSDQIGYYIVRVVTDANIYTEKVLIFK